MRVLLVSHCDFKGNSAFHVYGVADALARRGYEPTVCVPENREGVTEIGMPPFPVLNYDEVVGVAGHFGARFDLVHAWTPRELVRQITSRVASTTTPYVVHLEDNESVVTSDDVGRSVDDLSSLPQPLIDRLIGRLRSHPVRAREFLEGAAGVTVIVERLLEFRPEGVPSAVVWPGFDERLMHSSVSRAETRRSLNVGPETLLIFYPGNIHPSNVGEVESLYLAVVLLRRSGVDARLVKTGWNMAPLSGLDGIDLSDGVVDLGFVERQRIGDLLAAADVLVQPGGPSDFNDYRFPSKLPEFLASGKPVVMPRTNLGLHLEDGRHALLLDRGDAQEIFEKVRVLVGNPGLMAELGDHGREFAQQHLTWDANAAKVIELYEAIRQPAVRPARAAERPSRVIDPPAKLIAFYLPQFHAIPENDEWWGEGFTEWTNVQRARPLFRGHYHPQLPSELGFYDLRDPTVVGAQASLAREYGIYGFCFYYYWFNGRRVLEEPLDAFLQNSSPQLPFCYCWANENWTRRWDGSEDEILLRQDFGDGWAERLIRDLLPAMADPRYIRVADAPLFLVYRADAIPNPVAATEAWRRIARAEAGFDIHLAAVQSFGIGSPLPYGFDAAVEFPPHTEHFSASRRGVHGLSGEFSGFLEDYRTVQTNQLSKPLPPYLWYRGVMPAWDNTARRGLAAHIILHSSPARYHAWLRKLVLQTLIRARVQEPLIFVNAWNEWAEGTFLEPDVRYGRERLEATWAALVDGFRQYGASQAADISESEAADYLRASLPPV